MVALFVGSYFGAGRAIDPARARELATPLDAMIPFVPWTIHVYLWIFPASFLPAFIVRSRRLYRRVLAAYAIAIAVSVIVFAAWPVTSAALRADPAKLDPARFTDWCLRTVYRLDTPLNLFPSLHLSIAALAAGALWKARRAYGAVALVAVGAISVSICTVKQHFVLDGIGGLVLGAAIYAAILRPFRPNPAEGRLDYAWPGVLFYLAFQGLMYVVFLALFLSS